MNIDQLDLWVMNGFKGIFELIIKRKELRVGIIPGFLFDLIQAKDHLKIIREGLIQKEKDYKNTIGHYVGQEQIDFFCAQLFLHFIKFFDQRLNSSISQLPVNFNVFDQQIKHLEAIIKFLEETEDLEIMKLDPLNFGKYDGFHYLPHRGEKFYPKDSKELKLYHQGWVEK